MYQNLLDEFLAYWKSLEEKGELDPLSWEEILIMKIFSNWLDEQARIVTVKQDIQVINGEHTGVQVIVK